MKKKTSKNKAKDIEGFKKQSKITRHLKRGDQNHKELSEKELVDKYNKSGVSLIRNAGYEAGTRQIEEQENKWRVVRFG